MSDRHYNQTPVYDNELQAWTSGGTVIGCGHTEQLPHCIACNYAGWTVADVRAKEAELASDADALLDATVRLVAAVADVRAKLKGSRS